MLWSGRSNTRLATTDSSSWSSLFALAILFLLPNNAWAACPIVGGTMSLTGACTLANLQSQGCDPTTALGLTLSQVQQLCANAAVTFGSVTNNY